MTARRANGRDTHNRATAGVERCIDALNDYNKLRRDSARRVLSRREMMKAMRDMETTIRLNEQEFSAIRQNSENWYAE